MLHIRCCSKVTSGKDRVSLGKCLYRIFQKWRVKTGLTELPCATVMIGLDW
jgi:hypothetical protein